MELAEVASVAVGALFGVSVFAHLSVMLLTFAGLLWSPIAAAIADSNHTDRCGSAKASAWMFLPWLYVRKSMSRDSPMALRTVRRGYVLVYMLWLLGPGGAWVGLFAYFLGLNAVFTVAYLFFVGPGEDPSFTHDGTAWRDTSDVISALLTSALTGLIAYFCLLDRRVGLVPSLRRMSALYVGQATPIRNPLNGAIQPEYLSPFVRVTIWSFASPILLIATFAIVLPIRGGVIVN